MKIYFNGSSEDFNELIVSAVKYGIGTREFVSSRISNIVQKNVELLNEESKKRIIRKIKEEARFGFGNYKSYNPWIKLLDLLEREAE